MRHVRPSLLLRHGVAVSVAALSVTVVAARPVGAIEASVPVVVQTIPVGQHPAAVSSDGTHVWVANSAGTVTELDASTGAVLQPAIPIGVAATAVYSDGTHVWVTDPYLNTVVELDAATGTPLATIQLRSSPVPGAGPAGVVSDGTHVWVADAYTNDVVEIDAATATIVGNPIPVGVQPQGIATDGVHVWVADDGVDNGSYFVTELDASTATQVGSPIEVSSSPIGIAVDAEHVWVSGSTLGLIEEIDPTSQTVVNTISIGGSPWNLADDGSHVWAANYLNNTVAELDPAFGTVLATIPVGTEPDDVSSDGQHAWVANYGSGTVSELSIPQAPSPPTSPHAVAGDAQAAITWGASNPGADAVARYTVTASPGGRSCTTPDGVTTTCTVAGLTNGTTYTFTVRATSASGTSAPSAPSNPVTPMAVPPDPPLSPTATAGDGAASVRWSAPAPTGTEPILDYTATSAPGGHTCTTPDASTRACTVTGLTNGMTYTFTVTARNAAGSSSPSAPSNPVTPLGPVPNIPGPPTATAGDARASVQWSAPAPTGTEPILDYTVTSTPGGHTCTTPDPSTTACTVTGLTNGTPYTFTVTARNLTGSSSPSSPSNAVTPRAPPNTVRISPFPLRSARLTDQLKAELAALLQTIVVGGYTKVSLTGYTNPGTDSAGQKKLSATRALAVERYLAAHLASAGDAAVRLSARGAGAVTAATAEGKYNNRRVDAAMR
jgi:YVTN family beta-propeller protein